MALGMGCISNQINVEIDNSGNIDCRSAKQILAKLYEATAATAGGKSYKWGERQVTKADGDELQGLITFYQKMVSESCSGKHKGINVRYVSMPGCT